MGRWSAAHVHKGDAHAEVAGDAAGGDTELDKSLDRETDPTNGPKGRGREGAGRKQAVSGAASQ